jgi:hypothetical protein
MADQFPSDLFLNRLRRSKGVGIGTVGGSVIGLQVSLDVGSTWYALDAAPASVESALSRSFSDFDLVREINAHSPLAGTTIDLIITGLSAGAGLVAAEFLKEAGKDLWKAFKSLLPRTAAKKDDGPKHGDRITLTLMIDNRKVTTAISLPSSLKGMTTAELLQQFCENAAADLYMKESAQILRDAPIEERLRAHKDKKRKHD